MGQGGTVAPPRRDEALAYIIQRIAQAGVSPSHAEIGRALQPPVSATRAGQLVDELQRHGLVGRTPGAARGLYVRDVAGARLILEETLRRLGWPVAAPMGELSPPLADRQLPRLPEIEYLADD